MSTFEKKTRLNVDSRNQIQYFFDKFKYFNEFFLKRPQPVQVLVVVHLEDFFNYFALNF